VALPPAHRRRLAAPLLPSDAHRVQPPGPHIRAVDPAAARAAGIIRPARRPPGWSAPGPAPAARPQLGPRPGEDLCWLAGNWRIFQRTDGHRFSADDLVTAHFAARLAPLPARIADIGCGIGSVLLFLAWRFPAARCQGAEAQPLSAELARRSIAWNGVESRCAVQTGDFRDPATLAGLPPFDLVTGTPPYFPRGTGTESDGPQRAPCRFEHRGGIEDYCHAAVRLMGEDGLFVACAPAAQAQRVEAAARAAGLGVERWRDVVGRAGKAPLFSVFAMKTRHRAQALVREPPLVVRDAGGRRTVEFVALRAEMGLPP
jgi:tRNA1(Val) A37 N6-methylase TrmN6